MPTDAPTAFFSYSREDSEFALRLAGDLKAAGAVVWIDQLDITPGQEWDNAIEDAVTQCPRMLLILTTASVKSKKVRNEIAFALDEEKTIIPVLYQDCMVPLQLRRIQHIDFRTDYARGLKALVKVLGVEQPLPPVAPAPPAVQTPGQPEISAATAPQRAMEQERLEEERKHAPNRRGSKKSANAPSRARLEEERRLAAGATEQQPIAQEGTGKALAADLGFLSKAPIWAKVAAAAIGILVVALIVYRVSSRQPSTEQATGTQQPAAQSAASSVGAGTAAQEPAAPQSRNETGGPIRNVELLEPATAAQKPAAQSGTSNVGAGTGAPKPTAQSRTSSVGGAAWRSGWAVGEKGTILHTADGGQSWEAQSSGTTNRLYSIFGSSDGAQLWAVGHNGTILHYTAQAGRWEAQSSGTTNALEFHFRQQRWGAVVGGRRQRNHPALHGAGGALGGAEQRHDERPLFHFRQQRWGAVVGGRI